MKTKLARKSRSVESRSEDESPFVVHVDAFFDAAKKMRRELDARLSDARDPFDAARFAWEPWHVFGQFSLVRAPSRSIFARALSEAFERRLLGWARLSLGASELGGPPWLSSLTHGDFQALHRDSPNGHFAFSFGLSRANAFKGGETLVATFDLLDYFRRGAHSDREASSPLFIEIASRLNRLVVFDARIPHAVRAVEGPRDVRDGRIAIQGWLRAAGCIAIAGDANVLSALAEKAIARVRIRDVAGLLSIRVENERRRVIANTLANTSDRARAAIAREAITTALTKVAWPRGTDVIVPVLGDEDGARVAPRQSQPV